MKVVSISTSAAKEGKRGRLLLEDPTYSTNRFNAVQLLTNITKKKILPLLTRGRARCNKEAS